MAFLSEIGRLGEGSLLFLRVCTTSWRISSAIPNGSTRIADSTPVIISSTGNVFGVTAKLSPLDNSEMVLSLNTSAVRLCTAKGREHRLHRLLLLKKFKFFLLSDLRIMENI